MNLTQNDRLKQVTSDTLIIGVTITARRAEIRESLCFFCKMKNTP